MCQQKYLSWSMPLLARTSTDCFTSICWPDSVVIQIFETIDMIVCYIILRLKSNNYSNKGMTVIVLTSTNPLFVILKLGMTERGSKLKPI